MQSHDVHMIERTRELPVIDPPPEVAPAAAAQGTSDAPAALLLDGRSFDVPRAGGVVGRRPDCAVRIDHPGVSRRHLSLRPLADGSWLLHDLGSTNGVWVNGERVEEPRLVRDGDVLGLGRVRCRFRAR